MRNFVDARKLGDGDHVFYLHKFLMLHFKLGGRIKYSFQVLHHVAQVECLLTPYLSFQLRWNRSVNNRGLPDSNIELDRELEHRNRYFKEDVKAFRGKVTSRSIDRVSQATESMQAVLGAFDKSVAVRAPSGRHVRAAFNRDVLALVNKIKDENLFVYTPGRRFQEFPLVATSLLDGLDQDAHIDWMRERVAYFSTLNIYQSLQKKP